MRPVDRAAVQRLGAGLFSAWGDYQAAMGEWLRDGGVVTQVAVDSRGRPVGFAMVTVMDGDGYLLGIGTDSEHRRLGLGRRLLVDVLRIAERRRRIWGISQVRLDVACDNHAAIALFRDAGFEPCESVAGRYASGHAILAMRLRLDPPLV